MRNGWRETTLGEVAEFLNGYPFKPSELGEEGLPVIRIQQLLDPSGRVDRSLVETPRRCQLENGDLVFSWSGTLAVRLWDRGPALLNQHLFKVVERHGVDRKWLSYALDHAIDELSRKTHGTTMKHVTKATLLPHTLLLPPLDEQRRIVDLIATVDEAIQGAESEAITARMQLGALRTELIDRSDAPRSKLSDVLETVDGGRSPVTEGRPPGPGERGVLKLSAVRTGQFDLAESKAVSPAVSLPASALVSVGDVLITRSNTPETVGAVCFVDEVRPHTYLSDLTLRLTPRPDCLPAYLAAALTTTEARRQITSSAKGTSGSMRKISRQTIAELTIPLPDRDHQQSVVSLLDAAAATVKSVHASRAALLRLRSSLLSDLLSGDHEIPASYD